MVKIYMIDSENVGDSWIQLLSSMTEEDKLFVFYTDKSPYISYESLLQVIAYGNIPSFIKCHEGRNALDFQLVSELGYKIATTPSAEFIVVSDDNGFDAVVKYWSDKQYKIRRIGRKFCRNVPGCRKDAQYHEKGKEEEVKGEEGKEEEVNVEQAGEVTAAQLQLAASSLQETPLPVVYEAFRGQADGLPEKKTENVTTVSAGETEQTAEGGAEMPMPETKSKQAGEVIPVVETSQNRPEPAKAAEQAPAEEPAPVKKPAPAAEQAPVKKPASAAETAPVKKPAPAAEPAPVKKPASAGEQVPAAEQALAAEQPQEQPQTPERWIRDIVYHCTSVQPEKDAKCVYELFFTLSMATLTEVNTALKIFIGNEEGNDIYRELKEHQECRKALDALYLPTQKERFLKYVGIVLERSDLQDLNAEELGKFLLRIPRKNLNSIRASMQKEFGSELGSRIYTVYKPHIKVLNKI